MRLRILAISVLLAMLPAHAADGQRAKTAFLSNDRAVNVAQPDRQNYVAVDDAVWQHARADLADLRLYDSSGNEVPYAVQVQGETNASRNVPASVFNLAKGAHGTEFLIDISPSAAVAREYDRVTLGVSTRNFVGTALVQGTNDFSAGPLAEIGNYSIFDFTRENLGNNFELRLPELRYRYLRVELHAPIPPEDVKGATVQNYESRAAAWTAVGTTPQVTQSQGKLSLVPGDPSEKLASELNGHYTVVQWMQAKGAPLDRVAFDVGGTQNFMRRVELQRIEPGKPGVVVTSGTISRVHLERDGEKIDCNKLELDTGGVRGERFVLLIDNGDDPPLPITRVQPQALERRVYFDPAGHSAIKLYYGDEKAGAPVYDYAKLFQLSPNVSRAELGPDEHNPAYSGRPDDRPWTEQHQWIMWLALILVVMLLGAVALKGMVK